MQTQRFGVGTGLSCRLVDQRKRIDVGTHPAQVQQHMCVKAMAPIQFARMRNAQSGEDKGKCISELNVAKPHELREAQTEIQILGVMWKRVLQLFSKLLL